MLSRTPRAKADLAKLVEKQMRNWELAGAQQAALPSLTPAAPVLHFVTISRTVESGGTELANLLGERLNWPVFDREILQAMAGDDQVRARLYEHLDERGQSWIENALHWLIKGELQKQDYFYQLTETVLALARQGPAIFLGRAADLILPAGQGLRVRVTAPLAQRAQVFARESNIPEAAARDEVGRIDQERAEFRRHHFGPDANADTCYDLMLNLAHFTPAQAVEVLVTALRQRAIIP
jgi:cytidylate kinase